MDDRIRRHIERLLVDASDDAARGEWARARALGDAVLALDADNEDAERILHRAHAAMQPGDRRQLTVLFCDVVGSTALSVATDPEVTHDILRSYQEACTKVVRRHDGHISQYVGDGVVVFFGYPRVHEDDARRAVGAGLDLLEAMRDVAETARVRHGFDFHVRVAVHTGLVVRAELGGPARGDRDAIVGQTPNIAARLQDQARPDTLLIGETTEQLVRGLFECVPRGPLTLRGVDHPILAYEVTGRTPAESRLEAEPAPAHFVARDRELAHLAGLWAAVQDGGSASILLEGEPGVGKSRLALEFRRRLETDGHDTVSCACSSYRTSTPLYPVQRLLATMPGLNLRGETGGSIEPLRTELARLGSEHLLRAFADLLHLAGEDELPEIEIDPQQVRHLVLDTLVKWLATAAVSRPVVVVVDDLQWADPSTLELMERIVNARLPGLLLLATAREGARPSWPQLDCIVVEPMSDVELRGLLGVLAEIHDLTEEVVVALIERSDGIPLYLEELVGAGADRAQGWAHDSRTDTRFTAPPALLEPLLARLASPEVDLSLAQVMATIGHEVDAELLGAVTGLGPPALRDRVAGLMRARLIEQSTDGLGTYRFRHHLLGEVAYETQLLAVRRRRHSVIADVLPTLEFPGTPVDAAALGHHLERADRIPEAIDAHVRAAGESIAHGAIAEAVAQLDHAMELLDDVTDDGGRLALELTVRQSRGMAWASLAGYAAPAAAADLERCADLCRELGPAVDGVPSLMAVWYYCVIHGELDRAEEVILVDRRRFEPDEDAIPEEAAWSGIRFGRGDIRGAIDSMETFLTSPYAVNLGSTPAQWPLPDDPVVNTWSVLGLARWIAADPVGSEAAFRQGEARAARLDFPHGPFCRAYVLLLRTLVYRLARMVDEASDAVREMAAIAERHGFALFSMCSMLHGTLVDSYGDPDKGAAAATVAFDQFRLIGMDLWNPWGYTVIGEIWLLAGNPAAALEALVLARSEADRTGSHFYSAETRRLGGLAKLGLDDDGGLEDLREAASLASRQGARLFELRSVLDLVRCGGSPEQQRLQVLLGELGPLDGLPELAAAGELLHR